MHVLNNLICNGVIAQLVDKKRKLGKGAYSTGKIEKNNPKTEDFYSVSETQEIYICVNATNKEHTCDYGICRNCYIQNDDARRGNRSRRKDFDIDDSACNHKCLHSLQQFFDREFFKKEYMQQVKERNIAWTSRCGLCNIQFVATTKKGKLV